MKDKKWKALEKQCMDYMDLKRILYIHLTTHITRKIGDKFFNFAIKGNEDWPDFIIFFTQKWSYYPKGETIFVECKTGKARLTKGQIEMKSKLLDLGYRYGLVKTFEEFKELIDVQNYAK